MFLNKKSFALILIFTVLFLSLIGLPTSVSAQEEPYHSGMSFQPEIKTDFEWNYTNYFYKKGPVVEYNENLNKREYYDPIENETWVEYRENMIEVNPVEGLFGILKYVEIWNIDKDGNRTSLRENIPRYQVLPNNPLTASAYSENHVRFRRPSEPVYLFKIQNVKYPPDLEKLPENLKIEITLQLTPFGENVLKAVQNYDLSYFYEQYYFNRNIINKLDLNSLEETSNDLDTMPIREQIGSIDKKSIELNMDQDTKTISFTMNVTLEQQDLHRATASGYFGAHSLSWELSSETGPYIKLRNEQTKIVLGNPLYFEKLTVNGSSIGFNYAWMDSSSTRATSFDLFISSDEKRTIILQKLDEDRVRLKTTDPVEDPYVIRVDDIPIEQHDTLTDFQNDTPPCWYYDGENARIKHETDTLEIAYESTPPQVTNVSVSEPLIDRKQDNMNTNPVLESEITVTVKDNDGYEDIENVKLSIRDNNDTVLLNGYELTDSTVVDNKTKKYFYTYNPENDLENLGGFDLKIEAVDTVGETGTYNWAKHFTVTDGDITLNLTPNPDLGFAKSLSYTASGTIGLVNASVSTSSGTLIDQVSGSTTISGTSYSHDFTIEAGIGENVRVLTYVTINNAVDGQVESSYVVNENQKYTVYLRWEENHELVPEPIENKNLHLSVHFENYTSEIDLENNPENITLQGQTTPFKATIYDNDKYQRTRLTFDVGEITFILNNDPSELGEYQLTLEDYTNNYTYPDGQVWIWKTYENQVMKIDERWWDGSGKAYPILEIGRDYRYAVHNSETGETTWFPTTTFPSTLEKTIRVVEFTEENIENDFLGVTYEAYRDNQDNIYIKFTSSGEVDSTDYYLYNAENDQLLTSGTMTNDNWIVEYAGENDEKYRAKLTFHCGGETTTIHWPIGIWVTPHPGPGSGIPHTHLPVAVGTIAGVLIVGLVAMGFRKDQEGNAMLAIAIVVAFLDISTIFIGITLMPLQHLAVVFLLAFAVMFKLAEGMK